MFEIGAGPYHNRILTFGLQSMLLKSDSLFDLLCHGNAGFGKVLYPCGAAKFHTP